MVQKLDRTRPGWKKNTVIVMDNAKYHTSKTFINILKSLNIPIMFTGPHSYSASPIELFFAAFKRADINPRKIQTGKR